MAVPKKKLTVEVDREEITSRSEVVEIVKVESNRLLKETLRDFLINDLKPALDLRFELFEKRQDAKFDKKFEEFEKRQDAKFDEFEKRQDAKFDEFEKRQDAKFDEFETKQDKKIDGKLEQFRQTQNQKIDEVLMQVEEVKEGLKDVNAKIDLLLTRD